MTDAYAIPNYVGQVEVAACGDSIGSTGIVIPCARLQFADELSIDSLYSAASSPRPDTFPGFSGPGSLEFWGPWRSDFNPYTQDAPVFLTGQTVQCQFSIYAGTLDGLFPQALVAAIEFSASVDPEGVTPWWHMLLVGNWQFLGLAQTGSDWARTAGGDNDAGDAGF